MLICGVVPSGIEFCKWILLFTKCAPEHDSDNVSCGFVSLERISRGQPNFRKPSVFLGARMIIPKGHRF